LRTGRGRGGRYFLASIAAIFLFLLFWHLMTDVLKLYSRSVLPSPLRVATTFF